MVLCLGLLDHVRRPFELFELMARSGAELLVIDTEVSRARASLFELARLYNAADALEGPLVLVPSRQAVCELASELGFRTVALETRISDYAGMQDYRRRRRLAFIGSRTLSLEGLPEQREEWLLPWWARDPRALLAE